FTTCGSLPSVYRCHAVPGALLPFPTRRSSDLQVDDSHVLSCCVVGVLGVVDQVVGLVDLCGELFGEDVVQVLTVGVLVEGGGVGDRKSTRLNSSHVKISYAVFCLKKKNISALC